MTNELKFFMVRCKNQECPTYITTDYSTMYDTPKEMATQMKQVADFEQTCPKCGLSATYTYQDLGIVHDKKKSDLFH